MRHVVAFSLFSQSRLRIGDIAMKLIAAFVALLICTALTLQASDDSTQSNASPSGMSGRGGKGQMGQGHGKLRQKMLEMFDANHDGKLEGDELEKAKAWLKEKR